MDPQLKAALVLSVAPNIEQGIKNGKYRLQQGKGRPYLVNGQGRVVCILNGEVVEQQKAPQGVKLAKDFYGELPESLKQLAQRQVARTDSAKPMMKESSVDLNALMRDGLFSEDREKNLDPYVSEQYFSGNKQPVSHFKQEHKELCNFMRRSSVLGKVEQHESIKATY